MKYFLILGTNPSLSIAEALAYFNRKELVFKLELINKEVVVLETESEIDARKTIKELGGIVKIGQYISDTNKVSLSSLTFILDSIEGKENYKFKFGFSFYGRDYLNLNPFAMNIKKHLKDINVSSRWVIGRDKNLSSVIVEQNKMIDKGIDFIICKKENKYLVGRTLAVQDFKGLSKRDYGRPERDDESGMLPPKLAQIMINISGIKGDATILDPFCGSGTVLSEAALMDIKNIYGSDLSGKAVSDSQKNLNWIKKNNNLSFNSRIEQIDSTKLSKVFSGVAIDAIVTEPYLGPQRGAHEIKKTAQLLEILYSEALNEFSKILKKDASVVMVWPVFVSRDGDKKKIFLDKIKLNSFEIIPLIPNSMLGNDYLHLSKRGGIVYGRQGQKVWREIVLLKIR